MAETLGIIGIGQLASYLVAGLRNGGDTRPLVLSPRNAETARILAATHGGTVAADNQALVDASGIVLLATRPEQIVETCRGVTFRADQVIVSVAAGVSVDEIAPHADGATVVRCLPVMSAEVGAGPIPLFPANARAAALLAGLGAVVPLADEAQFTTASVMGCTYTWVIRLVAELEAWLGEAGLDAPAARTMALQTVHAASALGIAKGDLDMAATADAIARPGTYSLMGETVIAERGGFEAFRAACQTIHDAFDGR